MKRIFTLLFAFIVSISLSAKKVNPFSHKSSDHTKTQKSLLKSAQADQQPTSILYELWEDDAWGSGTTIYYDYESNVNGNVIIMTTSSYRQTYTYNEAGYLVQLLFEYYDGDLGQYVNQTKLDYTYNEYGETTQSTNSIWIGNQWIINSGYKYDLVYDSNENLIEEIDYTYTPGPGWVETSGYKTDYIYTGDLLTSQISYNRESGAWVPEYKIEWFYDIDDVLTSAYEYDHDGNDFVLTGRYIDAIWYIWDPVGHVENSYAYTYTWQEYNGSGDINDDANYTNVEKMDAEYPSGMSGGEPVKIIETYYVWDSGWVSDSRWTYEWSSNKEIEYEEYWNGSSWAYSYYYEYNYSVLETFDIYINYTNGVLTSATKTTRTYDTYGNLIEEKYESHSGDENWQMYDGQFYIITYQDGTSNILTRITQQWDDLSSAYVNLSRETYSYTPTSVNEKTSDSIVVYPTEFDSYLYINSSKNSIITIYDLSGNIVSQKQIFIGINQINTSFLPSGYYILKIDNNAFRVVKK